MEGRDAQVKVWWSPVKPPEPDHADWEFLVTVSIDGGLRKKVPWFMPDVELQQMFLAKVGRDIKHDDAAQELQDLTANWAALQNDLNCAAAKYFREHPV